MTASGSERSTEGKEFGCARRRIAPDASDQKRRVMEILGKGLTVAALLSLAACACGRSDAAAFTSASLSSSSCLVLSSEASKACPVTFPPGRAKLETNPASTGSFMIIATMGMLVVACRAARTAGAPAAVTRISTGVRPAQPRAPVGGRAAPPPSDTRSRWSGPPRSRGHAARRGRRPAAGVPWSRRVPGSRAVARAANAARGRRRARTTCPAREER